MAIKSDRWIKKMSAEQDMINPFTDERTKPGEISKKIEGNPIESKDENQKNSKEETKKDNQKPSIK